MTQNPDSIDPDDPEDRSSSAGRSLDEDAAWRAIIENYGPEPTITGSDPPVSAPDSQTADPPPGRTPVEPVETRWRDSLNTDASWDDEGHFIPPEPPPLPPMQPRRKLAWIGLFGGPLLLLLGIVLGIRYPEWITGVLLAGFAGGFVYLIATMPHNRPGSGSGDDGAVV